MVDDLCGVVGIPLCWGSCIVSGTIVCFAGDSTRTGVVGNGTTGEYGVCGVGAVSPPRFSTLVPGTSCGTVVTGVFTGVTGGVIKFRKLGSMVYRGAGFKCVWLNGNDARESGDWGDRFVIGLRRSVSIVWRAAGGYTGVYFRRNFLFRVVTLPDPSTRTTY